jgi:hypothetical protein
MNWRRFFFLSIPNESCNNNTLQHKYDCHRHLLSLARARSLSRSFTVSIGDSPSPSLVYAVWKMFCDVDVPTLSDASSSAATSTADNRHPSAPRLSSSCRMDFTPGMGVVSLQRHQLIATCGSVFPRASPISFV